MGGEERWESLRRDASRVLGYPDVGAGGEVRLGSTFLGVSTQTDRLNGQRLQSPSLLPPSPILIIPSSSRAQAEVEVHVG